MRKIELGYESKSGVTIMIFTEGTILKPKAWWSLYCHKSYLPIGNAVSKIKEWYHQGANIIYITSRKKHQAEGMASLLKKYDFKGTCLLCREEKENYQKIVEKIKPTILIEDNCKSIGGTWQMCITKVVDDIKKDIVSIVVPEFKGIDQLPVDLEQLLTYVRNRV